MHRSETYELVQCVSCGAEVSAGRDRTFTFGEDSALCFSCAVARGGKYDELHDHWEPLPNVAGLRPG
ncbi:MAG: hypothetical protein OXU20_19115 [Myxococcales bacterium]|nr:hypothetical protein [Myxococcales bacterium]MDD9965366.1 hypothetical protein [Myxococcales bacterium]